MQRRNRLKEQYRWKAENIVRFFDKLGMTKEQKEDFLASELAGYYEQGEIRRLDWLDTKEQNGIKDQSRIYCSLS